MVQIKGGGRMNKVLYELCWYYINANDCSNAPVSSRSVSFRLNLTVSQTRYRLRKLKKLGYVETPPDCNQRILQSPLSWLDDNG